MWDFETEPEFQEKLDWMRSFIDENLVALEPIAHELPVDEWTAVKKSLQDEVKARGLWGAFLDPELGGQGFGQLKLALMSEVIGRCMISMTVFGVQAPDSGNMELLAHGANEEQRRRWLEPNLRGDIQSAFALTEPFNAGADPTKISTTAVLDGDEWVINGHKWFITNASVADFILVFAETDPEQRPHRHASIFVVEKDTPGLNILRDVPTMAHPPHEYGKQGGQAERSLEIMCERAVSRESHGKLLAQHQMVQDFVALSHTELEAARLLTFRTAWKMDKYGASAVRADISMVKAHVSRVALDVLDRTIQVCGALGYSSDLPVEGWYRGTRFGTIGDGPDEVHKTVVARTLLKSFKPVEGWPSEHIPSRRPAAEEKWAELRVAAGLS